MNLFATSPQWLCWLLIMSLLLAAIQDVAQLKISNIIVGAVLLMGVAAMLLSGPKISLWQNLASLALVLFVGTILFSKGVLGGGDVKLLAAVMLWAGGATALKLISAILICGGILALFLVGLRLVAPASASRRFGTLKRGSGIPYGVAIAAGAIFVIATSTPKSQPASYSSEFPAYPAR
jgi:prepilin peptidase CpaA